MEPLLSEPTTQNYCTNLLKVRLCNSHIFHSFCAGSRVIMACREYKSALKAKDEIVEETYNTNVEVKLLDLGSLDSIANFAKDIHKSELTYRLGIAWDSGLFECFGGWGEGTPPTQNTQRACPRLLERLAMRRLSLLILNQIISVNLWNGEPILGKMLHS